MGSKEGEGLEDEIRRKVFITQPFWIGQYHVTFMEYELFCRDTGRTVPDDAGWGRGYRPVINVSWYDAKDYTDWLSDVTGDQYGLCTEEEYEYAMRAGTDTTYPNGNDPNKIDEIAWYWDNSGGQTHPVGEKKPNNWGIYDPIGNVWSWCDSFHTISGN
jgi:formylglycine-generating enzyme required for sulfatase activity